MLSDRGITDHWSGQSCNILVESESLFCRSIQPLDRLSLCYPDIDYQGDESIMPTINSASLTLTTVGVNTTINVTYNAVFSVLERRLAGLGLVFRDRIAVIGVDTPPDPTGGVITSLASINLAVTDGAAPQTIPRTASKTVLRSLLQEDIGAGDNGH